MSKIKTTASEVQLKARRTSLGKKSKEELINIILRKDKTERTQSAKINHLMGLLKEADELNENKVNTIVELRDKCNNTYDRLKVEIEKNGNLTSRLNAAEKDMEGTLKRVQLLKDKCGTLRKALWTCFGIITVLVVILCF